MKVILTAPVNPLVDDTVIVEVGEVPATPAAGGDAERLKSGGIIVTVRVAECLRLVLDPESVTV